MEEDIKNYSTNVMFRETPCIFINNLQTIKIILLKLDCSKLLEPNTIILRN